MRELEELQYNQSLYDRANSSLMTHMQVSEQKIQELLNVTIEINELRITALEQGINISPEIKQEISDFKQMSELKNSQIGNIQESLKHSSDRFQYLNGVDLPPNAHIGQKLQHLHDLTYAAKQTDTLVQEVIYVRQDMIRNAHKTKDMLKHEIGHKLHNINDGPTQDNNLEKEQSIYDRFEKLDVNAPERESDLERHFR